MPVVVATVILVQAATITADFLFEKRTDGRTRPLIERCEDGSKKRSYLRKLVVSACRIRP